MKNYQKDNKKIKEDIDFVVDKNFSKVFNQILIQDIIYLETLRIDL